MARIHRRTVQKRSSWPLCLGAILNTKITNQPPSTHTTIMRKMCHGIDHDKVHVSALWHLRQEGRVSPCSSSAGIFHVEWLHFFLTILHMSTKDCKSAAILDLGVANKSLWIGEFRNVNYKTSKVQITFWEDCVWIWKPSRCPDPQLSSLCVCVCLVVQSCPTFVTPCTVAHQAPLSTGFSSKITRVCCHFLLKGTFPI